MPRLQFPGEGRAGRGSRSPQGKTFAHGFAYQSLTYIQTISFPILSFASPSSHTQSLVNQLQHVRETLPEGRVLYRKVEDSDENVAISQKSM